ncbi:hemerythrin domain-containing protein [Neptuniibacter halophilus]|uniref:hemerythrin domain-containing protein n=1 Tax=Neptuniibacter halophilus TaxID=651666 RepID=UPI002573E330|nr:hemerythrin domain-containing protein [Neptuniibacter halophilus]
MTILTELHQDHVNLNKLLLMLQQQVDKLRKGEQPSFSLMGDVVEYIASYADGFHHPREDKLYEALAQRSHGLDEKLQACREEHDALKIASTHLSDAIDGVLHDAVMPMAEFADLLEEFVTLQVRHLNYEEGELFPLIAAQVSDEELAVLSQQLPMPSDPLFSEKRAHEYNDLYRELIEELNRS